MLWHCWLVVSDIAVFVLKRDVKLQPTNHFVGHHEEHPARKKWISVWCEVHIFAYGPADAIATPSSLASLKSGWFDLSGAGLLRLSWKRGRWAGICLSYTFMIYNFFIFYCYFLLFLLYFHLKGRERKEGDWRIISGIKPVILVWLWSKIYCWGTQQFSLLRNWMLRNFISCIVTVSVGMLMAFPYFVGM